MIAMATVFDWLYNAARWTWHDPDGYNFISGPLADITLLGGGYALLRHHNCHAKGCWRIGRHAVAGTGYVVCRKHHPDPKPTAEQISAEHAEHLRAVSRAHTAREAVVQDVRHVAHEVADDVHDVARDAREVSKTIGDMESAREPRKPRSE